MMEWHPPNWLINTGSGVLLLSIVALVLRLVGPWRQQISLAEERLRQELIEERASCERKLARADAENRIVKHRERGGRQLIYSLLHLVNMEPGPGRDGALEVIRATLHELERVEAQELAAFLGVPIPEETVP